MSRGDTWCLKNSGVVRTSHIEAGVADEFWASAGPCANTLTVELGGVKRVLKGRVTKKQEKPPWEAIK